MRWTWDPEKARKNFEKHKVSFEAAQLVFDDAFALDRLDIGSEGSEVRYIVTGVANGVILTVVYTERGGRRRIISARLANRRERNGYRAAYPETDYE